MCLRLCNCVGMHLSRTVGLLGVLLRRELRAQRVRLHLKHLILLIQLIMQLIMDTSGDCEVLLAGSVLDRRTVQEAGPSLSERLTSRGSSAAVSVLRLHVESTSSTPVIGPSSTTPNRNTRRENGRFRRGLLEEERIRLLCRRKFIQLAHLVELLAVGEQIKSSANLQV